MVSKTHCPQTRPCVVHRFSHRYRCWISSLRAQLVKDFHIPETEAGVFMVRRSTSRRKPFHAIEHGHTASSRELGTEDP